jgi:superoxide dismutase
LLMLTYIHVSLSSESDSFKTNGILGFVGLQHSYYLDFENCWPDYLNTSLDKLITWEAVAGHLARAKGFVNLGEPTIPEK